MAYKNKFGITKIITSKRNNLDISWDCDDLKSKNRKPVFLFTPNMDNIINHFHIELSKKQAVKLRDWLADYLKDVK